MAGIIIVSPFFKKNSSHSISFYFIKKNFFLKKRKKALLANTQFQDLQKRTDKIKVEAYKEFAERLKSYLLLNKKGEMSVVSFENIDNLLKEMVGEEE